MNNLAAELVKQIASYLDFNEERQLIATSKYNKETLFEGILRLNFMFSCYFLQNEVFRGRLMKYKLSLKVNHWYKYDISPPENIFKVTLLKVHYDDRREFLLQEGIKFIFKGDKKLIQRGVDMSYFPEETYINANYEFNTVQTKQAIGRVRRYDSHNVERNRIIPILSIVINNLSWLQS